jgi:hypothetical protein
MTFAQQVVRNVVVGKAVGTPPILAAREFKNQDDRLRERVHPQKTYQPPPGIDFARLSKQAYKNTNSERAVAGYSILKEFTSPDRVVYQHDASGHVIIAFRGTDVSHPSGKPSSRFVRDVTTDVLLGAGATGLSHRFYNAVEVTKSVISRYGRENVSVTGHSLGGSQALHVSNKLRVHAEAYNPHFDWTDAVTRQNYFHATIHVNKTDPVAAFYPLVHAAKRDIRYNKKAKPFMGQHGIDNFLLPEVKPAPKPTPMPRPAPMPIPNRPREFHPLMPADVKQVATFHHSEDACSRLPLYLQIAHGCRTAKTRQAQAYPIRAGA